MQRALGEMAIDGVKTTIPLQQKILADKEFQKGDYTIHWLENFIEKNKKV